MTSSTVHPSMYANMTSITLVYSRHLWYKTSMLWSIDSCQNKVPLTSIMWPNRGFKFRDHRVYLTEIDCWSGTGLWSQAKPSKLRKRAFCSSTRLHGHTTSTKALNKQRLSFSGWKQFEKYFLSAFFPVFHPMWHTIIMAVVHTGGYAVIQVKHRGNINLKLSVYF